jgi:predicted O-methyltransferase YrrM
MDGQYKIYKSRFETFPRLIREMGLKKGVEVGLREGFHSYHLLENTMLEYLWGIDIDYAECARQRLFKFGDRHLGMQARSPGIASAFEDGTFDFIHIDADHSYEGVKRDLDAWWPKLRSGGLFSGDDYTPVECNYGEGKYGVVQAVNEFVAKHGLALRITGLDSTDPEAIAAHSNEMGRRIDCMFRGEPYEPYDITNWYIVKP